MSQVEEQAAVVDVDKVLCILHEIAKLTDCAEIKALHTTPARVAYRLLDRLDEIDTYCETAEKELEQITNVTN